MLIVCPSCATSYMIDPAAVGPSGRMVRCARCKMAWHAGMPKPQPDVSEFVHGVIAEAERHPSPKRATPANRQDPGQNTEAPARQPEDDEFGSEQDARDGSPDFVPSPDVAPHDEPEATHAARPEPETIPPDDTGATERPDQPHVDDAPSLVPPIDQEPLPETGRLDADGEIDAEDIESFAARRERLHAKRQKRRRSSRWTAIILLLFGINVALIGARGEIVRYLPQTASLFSAVGLEVNLRNLNFENVKITKETHDGVSVLVVEGMIVSSASGPVEVPRLRFAVRNAAGQEIYTWTAIPVRSILGPGESQNFRSRLASPPADSSDVLVRFYNQRDALPGTK